MSDKNQTDIIEAFNFTSRYLLIDDLLNNPYCEQTVGQIYPSELQLNKANSSDTEAKNFDLNLSLSNDFNFEIVMFRFLDGDVLAHLPMVYIFRSLFVLQGCVLMLMTLTTETYLRLLSC